MTKNHSTSPKRELMVTLSSLSTRMKQLERTKTGDLSGSQLHLIPLISSFENPPTLGELAAANGSSYQNTRQLLVKLETLGYVTVCSDKSDSRAIRISLTKKGRNSSDQYYEQMQNRLIDLFSDISEADIEPALRVVATIYSRVETLYE